VLGLVCYVVAFVGVGAIGEEVHVYVCASGHNVWWECRVSLHPGQQGGRREVAIVYLKQGW